MKRHRCTHVKTTQSDLRRWLANSTRVLRRPLDSRPLVCEQLERRYALHGMDWFGESPDRYDYTETTIVETYEARGSFAQFRSWQSANQSFARSEGEMLASGVFGQGAAIDSSFAEMFADPCDRPHATKPEGEQGIGSAFDRPLSRERGDTSRLFAGIAADKYELSNPVSMKPLSKLNDAAPTKFDSVTSETANSIAANNSISSSNPLTKASESVGDASVQSHPAASSNSQAPAASLAAAFVSVRLIDFTTGSRVLGGLQNSNVAASSRSSFSSSSATNDRIDSARLASPTLTGVNSQATSSISTVSPLSRSTTTGGTNVVAAINTANETTVAISHVLSGERAGTNAQSSATEQHEAGGLQAELRSLIQKLASDQAAGKAGAWLGGKPSASLDGRDIEETFLANSQPNKFDDGMLELTTTTERLTTNAASIGSAEQLASAAQHRGQLIASLELNREFDLAGQTVQSVQSLIDPSARVHDARMAAEEIQNWNDRSDSAVGSAIDDTNSPTTVQPTLWQRSILPLSFLAIGGLLIRSRKQYRPPT